MLSTNTMSERPLSTGFKQWRFALFVFLGAVTIAIGVRLALSLVELGLTAGRSPSIFQSRLSGLALATGLVQLALLGFAAWCLRECPDILLMLRREPRVTLRSAVESVALVLGLAPAANAMAMATAHWVKADLGGAQEVQRLLQSSTPSALIAFALVVVVLPAVAEELIFRGLIWGLLTELPWAAVLGLQALAFGLFHGDFLQGIATMILGLGFGVVRYRTASLGCAMLAHGSYNLAVVVASRFPSTPKAQLVPTLLEVGVGLSISALAWRSMQRTQRNGKAQPG